MKILFIAPLPPPITGHSLASKVFLDNLAKHHETAVVDLSTGSSHDGSVTLKRVVEVGKALGGVWRGRQGADAVYMTVSESVAGNFKDLCIYVACLGLLSRTWIHLHGGTIGRELFARSPMVRRVNALFIRRLGGAIISGPSHQNIFSGMIEDRRIHVVPNFAQDHLFVAPDLIAEKFARTAPLRVLYMSGMAEAKGLNELAEAYKCLSRDVRGKLRVDFAGKFDSLADREAFERRISGVAGITYHGLVDEPTKQRLFAEAHIFCRPTAMFEGQPISILEAYASGCVVVTTGQVGIRDVFADGKNGFEVRPRSIASIRDVLERILADPSGLLAMALENHATAERQYRTATYNTALRRIVESAGLRAGRRL